MNESKDLPFPPCSDVYYVEYIDKERRAKLPYSFGSKFIKTVPPRVLLTDPIGNLNSVSITKVLDDAYFDDGWNYVGAFYGLQSGGWLIMHHPSVGKFTIEVTNLLGAKVIYPPMLESLPINDIEHPIMLDNEDNDMEDTEPLPLMIDRSMLITSVIKWLSFEEITGRTMSLPQNCCKYSLPTTDGHISVVDEYGKVWPCYYKCRFPNGDLAGIHRGWKSFYRQKKLFQGQGVSFGVMRPNSNVLYFTPSV